MRKLTDRILSLLRIGRRVETHTPMRGRGPCDHVIILDGTMSSLEPGEESNAGLIYKMLRGMSGKPQQLVYYEAGVQWRNWRDAPNVAFGRGINRQIRRAYGWLASHYHPGDRIFLLGYSRGAFAVRSLAGLIDQIGLLRADAATERNIVLAYRYYQAEAERPAEKAFVRRFCHPDTKIEMVGVFDTVKALGVRLPLFWALTEQQHEFHNHHLGPAIRHGFHALGLDETRSVYEPVMWDCPEGFTGHVEQVWFRGTHGDVGGQLGGNERSRPLANIPLVWMLENIEGCGLTLPDDWRRGLPCDAEAPSIGSWRGWGKAFLFRAPRVVGRDISERLHPTALGDRKPTAFLVRPTEALSPAHDQTGS